jgi:hypothetical protein
MTSAAPHDTYWPAIPVTPNSPKADRRRAIMALIICFLLVLSLPAGALVASMLGLFGAENIEASYEDKDLDLTVDRLGVRLLGARDEFSSIWDLAQAELPDVPSDELNYNDFTWTYDNYVRNTIELDQSELMALLNEFAPTAFWTQDLQVRLHNDKTIEMSGLLRFGRALDELFAEERPEIPVPGFSKLSFCIRMCAEIYENQLSITLDELKIGVMPITEMVSLEYDSEYIERIYRIIPGLTIHSLELTSRGTIRLDMTMPQIIRAVAK